ncbi:MAG: PilZ domain-containing protein [Proteobacteria bacterium]|nr:PilZ domain-containing protein [Pseudomonadota bacterium]
MKRPDLRHVLASGSAHQPGMETIPVEISSPAIKLDKRLHTRFDKAFVVVIGSEVYGDTFAVARNISGGGLLVEMPYAPPLGTVVTVHFQYAREGEDDFDEIVARAEVKHHHYLNFNEAGPDGEAASSRAIGLRFVEFIETGRPIDPDHVQ